MACFYCGLASVPSSDVGRCEETCGKRVCTQGVSARPHDYHADQCDCGCASLVCVYEMRQHAKAVHKSTVEQCFPSSASHVALGAAAAIEDSATIDVDGTTPEAHEMRRAVVRFVEFNAVPVADMPLPMDSNGRLYGELEFKLTAHQWPPIAALLVPRLMDNIIHSWPRARDEVKYSFGTEVAARIEQMVASGHADSRYVDKTPYETLSLWYEFSPRLTHLFSEHTTSRMRSVVQQLARQQNAQLLRSSDWRDMPQHLSLFAHQHAVAGNMMSP